MAVKLRTAILVLSTSPGSEGVTTAVWLKYFLFLRTPEVKLNMLYFLDETYTLVPAVINPEFAAPTKNRPPNALQRSEAGRSEISRFSSRDKFCNFRSVTSGSSTLRSVRILDGRFARRRDIFRARALQDFFRTVDFFRCVAVDRQQDASF
jgi:hypothetical protein